MKQSSKEAPPWFIYLIESDAGYYCGITTNLQRRFNQHVSGTGAKFFRRAAPKKIVYVERGLDRSEASKREHAIKQLTRTKKVALIASADNLVNTMVINY